jgi:hypothetical protein
MHENTKAAVRYATVVVLALLVLWIGFRLIEAMVPLMGQVIYSLSGFVGWAITIAGVILIAVLTIAMPLIVGAGLFLGLFWIADLIIRRVQKLSDDIRRLRQAISVQAREAAIDAAFLSAIALLAALVFYMGTMDFLEPFSNEGSHFSPNHSVAIRVLVVAAAACSVSKILFLIPVRSVKIFAVLAMIVVLFVAASILFNGYFAKVGVMGTWDDIRQSSGVTIVMVTSILLLLIALAYPFSPRGWRRMWHIESGQHSTAASIARPSV